MPDPNHSPATHSGLPDDLTTRTIALRLDASGAPETLDDKARTVEVVCATENPVEVYDFERWEVVPEVLLMSGCQIPASRQVPLLDTHYRGKVSSVLGSCRELRIEGDKLLGRACYSAADEASETAFKKTREGHLTDYSVGYRVLESTWVPEGEKAAIGGRSFEGPVKVATKWKVRELSTCPIGADELAKARAATPHKQPHQPPQKEKTDMNEKLRKFLESRGLAKDATEEDAWRYLETLDTRQQVPADQQVDQDALRAEGARAEQERITSIRSICERAAMDEETITAMITGGKTVEEARQAAFDHLTSQTEQGTAEVGFRASRVQVGTDERDKFRAAAGDALILRSGLDVAKPAAGADELCGYSLRELAREALRVAGQPTGGNALEMVGRALTTSDLPTLLGNTANRSLLAGWQAAEETWQTFCSVGSVSDFKTQTLARAGELDDLEEVPEGGEYKYAGRKEAKEEFKIATYGKIEPITRQAIINDDLGAISGNFYAHGEAAARKIGDIVYAVLISNPTMGDGVALFHANHGNLGTAGAINEVSVAEGIKRMKLQKDISKKRRLNIPARFLIAPAALEGAAEIFFTSNQFADTDKGATRSNPYAGNRFTRVYDARLDDDSSTAWYLAGPKGKTIKVFFLGGNQTPYIETRQGWTVDGVETKVRIDAGAKAVDWRGLLKNAGA